MFYTGSHTRRLDIHACPLTTNQPYILQVWRSVTNCLSGSKYDPWGVWHSFLSSVQLRPALGSVLHTCRAYLTICATHTHTHLYGKRSSASRRSKDPTLKSECNTSHPTNLPTNISSRWQQNTGRRDRGCLAKHPALSDRPTDPLLSAPCASAWASRPRKPPGKLLEAASSSASRSQLQGISRTRCPFS